LLTICCERRIFTVNNGILLDPVITHKGTPQGSILSPILFNFYLRKIDSALHPDTHILQYADDVVLFANLQNASDSSNSITSSIESLHTFLNSRGLDLAPHKSKGMIFSRSRNSQPVTWNISLHGVDIPWVDSIRFLGVVLDEKLNGKAQLKSLIVKGTNVARIILSLSGTWWGAHPSLLLSLYRSVFRSSIEYGAQVFSPLCNQGFWTKIQRIQYRIIRTALGLRQSTPICVLLTEACEPPLNLRFELLTSRYVYKSFSRRFSSLVRSLRRLEIASSSATRTKRAYLIRNVPSFKTFILQKHTLDSIHRSVIPSPHGSHFLATVPLPDFHSFCLPITGSKPPSKRYPPNPSQKAAIIRKFREFSSPLVGEGISIYTDGSKTDDLPVGAAVYSPELRIALKHKLPSDTSIFSAEAWALYQALILIESTQHKRATVFSDCRSVLEALSSHQRKSNTNYLIPLCRNKFHSLSDSNCVINLVWVPSHVGIPGNERADSLAGQAALNGRKPKFKVPCTDYCAFSSRVLREKTSAFLEDSFLSKGKQFYSLYFKNNPPPQPWFARLSIPREQIVSITRLRSNHYNLNASLHRKNIIPSASCDCGDPHQDINHIIFYCPLTRPTASHLISFLRRLGPLAPINIFPFLQSPSLKLCRLLTSFLKSSQILI